MNLIVGKQPLDAGRSEMIDLITEKTGLKSQDVVLIIDSFSFFIRKLIIEQGSVCVRSLGTFYIKPFSYELYGCKYHTIRFDPGDKLKLRVKQQKITKLIKHCVPFREQLKIVSKMFGLKYEDVKFIFRLYITLIASMLSKYKEYRIPRIGVLKIVNTPHSYISKKWNYDKPIHRINFKLSDPFFREINKKTNQYSVYARLMQMLYLVGESRDIIRKEYVKDDSKKTKSRK